MEKSQINRRLARVLFLSFKLSYINPTRQLFERVLDGACNLTIFGPGYSSLAEVKAGPLAFAEKHGPFDIVVADEFALLRDAVPEDQKHLHQFLYQACTFDPLLIHEGTRYYSFLKTFSGPRIITLLASDYYNFRTDQIEQLEEVGDYYVCWGQEFLLPKSAVAADKVRDQPQNRSIYEKWNDRYYDFLQRHPDRVLSTPHFVDPAECNQTRLVTRRYDWSVLGADYEARVEARSQLDAAGASRSGRLIPYIFAGFIKIGFHSYNKFWAIDFLNWIFRKAIASSRYGFTCGSALRWPIRKYFEIPAGGAVLAAERCSGFEALGFSHKVNALAVEADQILDAHKWLSSDPVRAQGIADAGRALVENRHTVAARSRQIAASLEKILCGCFAGSYWHEGELRFRDGKADTAAAQ
jgi:hypothetical protein